jgi:hypothetical protein
MSLKIESLPSYNPNPVLQFGKEWELLLQNDASLNLNRSLHMVWIDSDDLMNSYENSASSEDISTSDPYALAIIPWVAWISLNMNIRISKVAGTTMLYCCDTSSMDRATEIVTLVATLGSLSWREKARFSNQLLLLGIDIS